MNIILWWSNGHAGSVHGLNIEVKACLDGLVLGWVTMYGSLKTMPPLPTEKGSPKLLFRTQESRKWFCKSVCFKIALQGAAEQ